MHLAGFCCHLKKNLFLHFNKLLNVNSNNYWRKFSDYNKLLKTHTCGELTSSDVGKKVKLRGFLQYQRMGLFCVLRDSFGLTQVIFNDKAMTSVLRETTYESYIEVTGNVSHRPKDQINKTLKTGEIEVHADEFVVLNTAKKDIPFLIRNHNHPTEQLGMKYRYLDLRQQYLQDNLRFRSKISKKMRDFLQDKNSFVEITTPTLSVRTPGGSQEFVVPSRFQDKFYSLVQSPQIYKQLAIIGGFEKYFQFAVCYRDEAGKSDRQPEFMQLDIEMADTTSSQVMKLMEKIILESWPDSLETPSLPFFCMTYDDAMEYYGVDKPDTRFEWKIADVSQIMLKSDSQLLSSAMKEEGSVAKAFVIPSGSRYIKKSCLEEWKNIGKMDNLPGIIVLHVKEDLSVKGQAAKAFSMGLSESLIKSVGAGPGDSIVLALGRKQSVLKVLGKLRLLGAEELEKEGVEVREQGAFKFLWVIDFPLFEIDETNGNLTSCHHPFTAPQSDNIHLLYEDPLQVKSEHYDLVLNGCEIAGGSIRIHEANVQKHVLNLLDIDQSQLAFLLEALSCGAPPHGGIAMGFDRYISILRGSKSIREVMAFPKTSDGKCIMSDAPAAIDEKDIKLYNLQISEKTEDF